MQSITRPCVRPSSGTRWTKTTVLAVVLALALFACQVEAMMDRDACDLPSLPTSFNSVAFLEFNDEMHINQAFRINASSTSQMIDFELRHDSAIRFYVAPHRIDVDLYLYTDESPSTPVLTSGLGYYIQEVMFGNLTANTYRLEVRFFGSIPLPSPSLSFLLESLTPGSRVAQLPTPNSGPIAPSSRSSLRSFLSCVFLSPLRVILRDLPVSPPFVWPLSQDRLHERLASFPCPDQEKLIPTTLFSNIVDE